MTFRFEQNPISAYLEHFVSLPLGIYKTSCISSSLFSKTPLLGPSHSAGKQADSASYSTNSGKAPSGMYTTPSDLKGSKAGISAVPTPGPYLEFSTLSSMAQTSEKTDQDTKDNDNGYDSSVCSTYAITSDIEDIPSKLWNKITRISALLRNNVLPSLEKTSNSSTSRFITQLSDSSSLERLDLSYNSRNTPLETENMPAEISSEFDMSLGSSGLTIRASELRQIGDMIRDVIQEGTETGSFNDSDSSGCSKNNECYKQINKLVEQYNIAATLLTNSSSEVPLISI